AAYTYGIRDRMGGDKQKELQDVFAGRIKNLSPEQKKEAYRSKEAQQLRRASSEMMRPLRYGATRTKRQLQLPHDYQYDDAKPKELISSAPIFGDAIESIDGEGAVEAYAHWMTSPENPRFTKVIANRMWKRVCGIGVIEPVDDLKDGVEPSSPELMAHLEKLMVKLDYDLKQFLRVLYNLEAFQRQASGEEIVAGKPYHFPGPILTRMSAEQLWDSFVTLALPYADERKTNQRSHDYRMEQLASYEEKVYNLKPAQLFQLTKKGAKVSKKISDKMERLQKEMKAAAEKDDREAISRLRREYGQARNEQRTAFAKLVMGNDYDVRALYGRGSSQEKTKPDPRWSGFSSQLMRASELPTPAPPSHFLREFGQSDREVIENASREASVPQALTLLKGIIYRELYKTNAPLTENLVRATSPKEKIRILFLSILNREPSTEELEASLAEIEETKAKLPPPPKIPEGISEEKRRKYLQYHAKRAKYPSPVVKAYQGLAWALLNTRQFSFIQ
ncbi:MAG: DUF1553 domain-containing protein, partial [Opitutales bacterium]